jgi:hypothetical protein
LIDSFVLHPNFKKGLPHADIFLHADQGNYCPRV